MPKRIDDRPAAGAWPVLLGIRPLSVRQIPAEILAGITLAALAVPEVMGYARIAGMPVVTGIYTLIVPLFIYALLGASRHLVVGADSATAAILAAGLAGIAATSSAHYVALATVTALFAAFLLLVARLVRLGFLANFLSRTVLIGFLSGVGIQVALGQLPGMVGLQVSGGDEWHKLHAAVRNLDATNAYAIGISAAAVILILCCKKRSPRIPGALIAVIAATFASWALDLQRHLPVLGEIPAGFPDFGLPQIHWERQLLVELMPTAFAICFVILAQSAATARAYAERYGERFDEEADLVGLSAANLGAALTGTFVVNGSPTKSQIVDSAGGRTQFSMLTAGVIALLVLLFLTRPLGHMPDAVLAAVVFLIGLELIDLRGLREIYRTRPLEFWVAVVTMATVVLIGVEQGIMLALALSLVVHTRHGYNPTNVLLVPVAGEGWRARPIASGVQAVPGLIIYRFNHSMYYANAQRLTDEVTQLVDTAEPRLHCFCIELSAVDDVDFTAAEALAKLHRALSARGIRLLFTTVMLGESTRALAQVRALVGEEAIYPSLNAVVAAATEV
ncbi:SulP family inorganic anion transporter [Microbulbifer pacificus]|uniref:SulP family inorganic anion transporter n=1 Tax=Microbulbifer pacificus TaxID=407164 RepID=A0AAU0MVR9_9GAMM|nr:SulP family inorganic anion transporter [Microbulbifer pacificus]WOX04135.1 SulP family inorganic anion transporter [Microbulbifer pacificus]